MNQTSAATTASIRIQTYDLIIKYDDDNDDDDDDDDDDDGGRQEGG